MKQIRVKRKIFALGLVLLALLTGAAWGADAGAGTSASEALSLQAELSADIGRLQESVVTALEGLDLGEDAVAKRQTQLAELLETASADMTAWGYTEPQREQHLQILSGLNISYAFYTNLSQTEGNLQEEVAAESRRMEDFAAFGVASVDINATDALRQEIEKQSRLIDVWLLFIQSTLSKLRLDLADVARLNREAQEAEAGGTPLALPRTHALELESERMNVILSWNQLKVQKMPLDQSVAFIQKLQRRLSEVGRDVIFPAEVLDANIAAIQGRIERLNEEIKRAQKRLDAANAALIQARLRRVEGDPVSAARVQSRLATANYWELLLAFLDDESNFQKEAIQTWRSRYRIFHGEANGEEIWRFREEARKRSEEFRGMLEGLRTVESELLRNIGVLQLQIDENPGEVRQILTEALVRSQKIIPDVVNRYASIIPQMTFLQERLYAEASDGLSAIRMAEKVTSFSRDTLIGFLETELWQGEGYSVTVSKLIIAVLVFLSSFFLSSLGSRWIKNRMIKRFKASVTAANATQRIVFYVLWITFVLIALNIVKIPLTAFAFMGGAFAVGLGFGMQNIFNNLISGFIVIFSRPFKVNDIIAVAGTEGRVQDIGSRSTTIKTWDSLDVVLPNRYFLENSVTNWTGSDMKKRDILKVGVAYGSDSRRVEELLLQVARDHSAVLKDPTPFVLLKNFGDSALEFELYFWIDLRQTSTGRAASDMRHHLLSLFADEGIEIPFPQQDVHIIPQEENGKEGGQDDPSMTTAN